MSKIAPLAGRTAEIKLPCDADMGDSNVKFTAVFRRPNLKQSNEIKEKISCYLRDLVDASFAEREAALIEADMSVLITQWLIRTEGNRDIANKPLEYSDELREAMLAEVGYKKALANALARAANSQTQEKARKGN